MRDNLGLWIGRLGIIKNNEKLSEINIKRKT
jgi:hypothetical protein